MNVCFKGMSEIVIVNEETENEKLLQRRKFRYANGRHYTMTYILTCIKI